jgi:multidrug efflux pump subunit AcrA (membrane-fusion protein)
VSPSVDSATGTLAVRAIMQNKTDVLVPGYFVRVRAASDEQNSLLEAVMARVFYPADGNIKIRL